jgi:DNA recombination protein RmuC
MSETFEDIGNQITRLNDTYQKAHSQLYTGKGNVMNRLEGLRKMGITPKKQIKGDVDGD